MTDHLGSGIEKVHADRDQLRRRVQFAETMLILVRETSACEKTRALAAGAIETLKEMNKPQAPQLVSVPMPSEAP
jgi:hypothetical protein